MNAPHESPLSEEQTLLASDWSEQNQRWLTQALAGLRSRLDAQTSSDETFVDELPVQSLAAAETQPGAGLDDEFVCALDRCAALFGLSGFERELLLLSAGVELDAALRHSVLRAQGRLAQGNAPSQPTFSLAFRVLAQPHWDALSPQAPLRRWRLIETEGRHSPTRQPLYIDERILHFLTGVAAFDVRLLGVARIEPAPQPPATSPLAQRIAQGLNSHDARAPLVLLTQDQTDPEALCSAAREGLSAAGGPGLWMMAHALPNDAAELAETALLIDREAVLLGGVPVIELEAFTEITAGHEQRCVTLLSHLLSPAVLVGTIDAAKLAGLTQRRILRLNVPPAGKPALQEQTRLQVGDGKAAAFAKALHPTLQQFDLSPVRLQGVVEQVLLEVAGTDLDPADLASRLWQASRDATRGGLDALAQRVASKADFGDLVLPPMQTQLLREIAENLRHRHMVHEDWGLGGKTGRGLGLCVLFAGESGTGKTLAAEVIANHAELDLYRIDLATVVSKYIGETEKNLKRVFDAAQASGAVLLFDEADALYGKRSEVKDSHDRYANIEVAYLLQRVEAYRGLAILTTNFRSALDRAFLRRIRFVVQFPFPDDTARERIWRRELPPSAPLQDIDFTALARMQLSGGNIRSVALNAAFIAASAGEPITMAHVRHAAQREAAKLERTLSETSQKVWS